MTVERKNLPRNEGKGVRRAATHGREAGGEDKGLREGRERLHERPLEEHPRPGETGGQEDNRERQRGAEFKVNNLHTGE